MTEVGTRVSNRKRGVLLVSPLCGAGCGAGMALSRRGSSSPGTGPGSDSACPVQLPPNPDGGAESVVARGAGDAVLGATGLQAGTGRVSRRAGVLWFGFYFWGGVECFWRVFFCPICMPLLVILSTRGTEGSVEDSLSLCCTC